MKPCYLRLFTISLFSFITSISVHVYAQIPVPASTLVTENFNTMAGGLALPANWKVSTAGNGTTSQYGTGLGVVTQAGNNGTPTPGGAYNWGTTPGTDRAVGFMTDAVYTSDNSIMAFYQNTTASTTLTVSFATELYRVNTAAFSLSFSSSTNGTSWIAQPAGNISSGVFAAGASSYTFGSPQIIYKTFSITIPASSNFYLRWIFTTPGNINSQGLGLDNVAVYVGTATPVITAKFRDALSIDNPPVNQANAGDQLTYTNVIKNTGSGDATNVLLTNPAPAQTTYVGGSLKTSSLAKDETYTTPFNTALNVVAASGVLTNDFGVPAPAVLSFGPSVNSAATAAGGAVSSDNGGTLTVNANGSFNYTPPAGFTGNDKFAYLAGNGNLPNNDGFVTISVGTPATAVNDTYNVIGNVSISPNGATGLLNNDLGTNPVIVAVNGSAANVGANILTTNGGNLNVSANGNFTYNPAKGYEGSDGFTYTIDNAFATPGTATVTLTVAGMIWFVNNGGAVGDGRLGTPYNSIASFQSDNTGGANKPDVNDYIYVLESASSYPTSAVTLLGGQKFIGQDATVAIAGPGSITGYTIPPNSATLPAANPSGNTVNLVNAANIVTLSSTSNTVRGMTLSPSAGNAITGGFSAIVDVSETTVAATSTANGITLNAASGTFNYTSGAMSTAGPGNSFVVTGGTVTSNVNVNITHTSGGSMVSVTGGHSAGTLTFTTGTLNASAGNGLQFDNADGTYNFNGTTTLNGGDAGIDILNGSGGGFSFGTGTSVTGPTGTAFNIGGTANTAAVTYSGSITKNNTGSMVSITNHTTGTVLFQTGTLSATTATAGNGLQFDNADGTYNFLGTTALNGGDAGIDILNGSGGTFNFATTSGSIAITSPTGIAFNVGGTSNTATINYDGNITQANNFAMVNFTNHTTNAISFVSGNTLSATNGTGLQFDNADGTYNFNGTTSLNGGDAGIEIKNGSGGTFSFGNSCSITNPLSEVLNINSSTANVTYSGTFLKNNNTFSGISINAESGGTININGTSTKTLSTGTEIAVFIVSNTGTTINFSGNNLLLTTTSGTGFNATGGGTISVTGTGNTINATSGGTGLNVVNTSIASAGLNFVSISSAGGSATGIILDNTGTAAGNGGLTVTGDGSNVAVGGNSTGGTISGKTGVDGSTTTGTGIYLNATKDVVLRRMTINGTNQNFGIRGVNVTNFNLQYSTVSGTNGTDVATDEGSVNFDNMWGASTITNCSIDGGLEDNLNVVNTSGTLNRLVITGSTFGFNNTVSGNNNLLLESQNAGTVFNFTIQTCLIKGARADWINASNNSNSTMDAVIGAVGLGNTFDNLAPNAHPGAAAGGNRLVFGATGPLTFDIRANTFKGSKGEAIRVRGTGTAGGFTGTAIGYVRNNTIGVQATANSGSSEGSGIFVFGDGGSDMTVSVLNNTVYQYNNHGIRFDFGDEINDGSVFNITCTGNTVNTPGNINSEFNGMHLNNGTVGATDNFATCFSMSGNNLVGSGNGVVSPNNQQFRLRQRQSTTVRLPGYAGANNNDAGVVAFLQGQNTVTAGNGASSNTVPTGGGFIGGATCTVPGF